MPKRFSTARGRELAIGLRTAFEDAGLSGRRLAEVTGWHESKISNVAQGKGGVTEQELTYLLGVCRVASKETEHLLELSREPNIRGWWQQHGSRSPIRQRTVLEHLEIAKSVMDWQAQAVPYFLRTADYMRHVTAGAANVPSLEVDERVKVQAEARKLAWRRTCEFYIHESALLLPVGDVDVQEEQLGSLLYAAELPNVTLRIVPFKAGAHAGLSGPFTKLSFEKYEPIVWLAHENSDLFLESPEAVEGYKNVATGLRKACLSAEESKRMITEIAASLEVTQSPDSDTCPPKP